MFVAKVNNRILKNTTLEGQLSNNRQCCKDMYNTLFCLHSLHLNLQKLMPKINKPLKVVEKNLIQAYCKRTMNCGQQSN